MDTIPIRWRFELFGGLRADADGHEFGRFPTQKTAALLARLVYPPCRRHPREQLVDLLWPDADADSGRNRLSQALVWLRPRLEPDGAPRGSVLLTDRAAVGLDPGAVSTDVADFEAALKRSQAAAGREAEMQALILADDLYRGELLPGLYEDWVLAERSRLAEAHLNALRRLAALYETGGEPDPALAVIRRVLDVDPLREEAHCDLMRLLAAGGRTAAALRHFQELERLLARELDVAPSPASRALAERLRRSDAPPSTPQVSRGLTRLPPLPVPLTRFFGRDPEIARLEQMVRADGIRLVTLLGTGGSGKTRLALEAAVRLSEPFGGAVAFVPLAALDDPGAVPAAIAAALLLPRAAAAPLDDVEAALSGRPCLLILDNLEHLIDGIAPLVQDLLGRLPSLTLFVTSRQRLGVEGEQELAVTPLSLPPSSAASPEDLLPSASVRLFVDRARAVRPGFSVTAQNAVAVARVCERLEGVPLAIELCAAWAQTLTPAQMLTQLARRFDLLVSRRADIVPRHRTLRAALEYSLVQLPPDLQRVFAFLSVFRGGWTLAAAEAVCAEAGAGAPSTLDALTELRERSLLVAEEDGAEMRYRMLEALREFAAEQRTLAVETALRRRHADYFLHLAEDAEANLRAQDQALWLRRLDVDLDNLRAALGWLAERRDWAGGLRLAAALSDFWERRGHLREAQQWLERLLALMPAAGLGDPDDVARLRARARNAHANALQGLTDFTGAAASAQEALAAWRVLGDASGAATSLEMLAAIAMMHEDYGPAVELLEEARSLARGVGDGVMAAGAVHSLGRIALAQEDWPGAWASLSESLCLHRALGDRNKAAAALNNLGLVALYRGDLPASRDLLQQALSEHRELGDRPRMAISCLNIGTVERLAGQLAAARSVLREAVSLASEVGDRRVLAWCVKGLGHLACAEGDPGTGVRLLAASESLRALLGISFKPADPEELARDTALARAALGGATFDAAWAAGLALPLEVALAEAFPPGADDAG